MGKEKQLVSLDGGWMTYKQKQELVEYADREATMRERAYQDVVSALKRIVDFFQIWELVKPNSKDEQLAIEQQVKMLDYLTKLKGDFSKASTVYHARLIRVSDNVSGIIRMPDADYINTFLEAQAMAQDTLTHVLQHPEALEEVYAELKKSPLLDRELADLIAIRKQRAKSADISTINAIQRVDEIIEREKCTITAAIDKVIGEGVSTASHAALWAAYYRIHPVNSVTDS